MADNNASEKPIVVGRGTALTILAMLMSAALYVARIDAHVTTLDENVKAEFAHEKDLKDLRNGRLDEMQSEIQGISSKYDHLIEMILSRPKISAWQVDPHLSLELAAAQEQSMSPEFAQLESQMGAVLVPPKDRTLLLVAVKERALSDDAKIKQLLQNEELGASSKQDVDQRRALEREYEQLKTLEVRLQTAAGQSGGKI